MTTMNVSGGGTRERTSITMEGALMRRAKSAGGGNLSGYIEQAVREKLISDSMLEVARLHLLDPMDDVAAAAEADAEAAA
ncbi:hypothetical protein EV284_6368 [Streptomyces sp. BK022]|uniref:hypothetical protein n=1 Tax=Streptomyces sp. BK022 TaxID=2512123 RepID=UPI001028B357|nr:hypothetical protein [Streptomyces sp. BK022]RZU28202.1 hypothetical protein EV284_6368 [Streptomyces sp. BK022]